MYVRTLDSYVGDQHYKCQMCSADCDDPVKVHTIPKVLRGKVECTGGEYQILPLLFTELENKGSVSVGYVTFP